MTGLDEAAFEAQVGAWLVEHGGYDAVKVRQSPPDFDAVSGLDTAELFAFLGATQGADWSELLTRYGNDSAKAQRAFVARLGHQLDARARSRCCATGSTSSGCRSGWRTSGRPRGSRPSCNSATPPPG